MEQKTKLCPHCKKEIDATASRCPHCHGKIYVWTTGRKVLAGLLGLIVFIAILGNGSDETNTPPPPSIPNTTPVISAEELAKWKTTPAGKLCTKHPTWTKGDCDKLIAGKIWIGMTYEMLVYSYGKPDSINPSNYGSGTKYQYCWNDYTPSCYYDNDNDDVIDAYN